jgi:hypothetical protein
MAGALVAALPAQVPLVTQSLDSGVVVRLHFAGGGTGEGRLVFPYAPGAASVQYCPLPYARCDAGQVTSTDARAVTRIDVGQGAAAILFAPLAYIAAAARSHDSGTAIGIAAFIGCGIGVLAGASAPTGGRRHERRACRTGARPRPRLRCSCLRGASGIPAAS